MNQLFHLGTNTPSHAVGTKKNKLYSRKFNQYLLIIHYE